ncbi:hypothetical protein [Paenibacillus cisolokensis]|nr:hypothetical protein [Paenibacillus cisolokensis]
MFYIRENGRKGCEIKMDSMTLILFGATGDLAKRKIFPALFNLFVEQKLPHRFSLIGSGREPLTEGEFRKHVELAIRTFSRRSPENRSQFEAFLRSFRYIALDVTNKAEYNKLLTLVRKREQELGITEQNRMYYLSVAPKFFGVIAENEPFA